MTTLSFKSVGCYKVSSISRIHGARAVCVIGLELRGKIKNKVLILEGEFNK